MRGSGPRAAWSLRSSLLEGWGQGEGEETEPESAGAEEDVEVGLESNSARGGPTNLRCASDLHRRVCRSVEIDSQIGRVGSQSAA